MKSLIILKIVLLAVVLSIIALSASAHSKESPCYSNGGHGARLVHGHNDLPTVTKWSKTPYADHYKPRKDKKYKNMYK